MAVPLDLAALLDREAIRDCIHRGALANDSRDVAGWKDAYWPDAHEDHPPYFSGNAHAFVDMIVPMLDATMESTWHQISNTIIQLDGGPGGNRARAMSYCNAQVRMKPGEDFPAFDLLTGVRYLDRFERRDGEWRILSRVTRGDWVRQFPLGGEIVAMGGPVPPGMHSPADPWHALFPEGIPPALSLS